MQYSKSKSLSPERGKINFGIPGGLGTVSQPTQALTEFVKHVADPLVDKGWNLHLKFGKGESQKEGFEKGMTPQKSSGTKPDKRQVQKGPPQERPTPQEMGTGGGW